MSTVENMNKALDLLIMEAYIVNRDIVAMKRTIDVCPSCSVEFFAEAMELDALAGTVMDVMMRLRALKRVGNEPEAEGGVVDETSEADR